MVLDIAAALKGLRADNIATNVFTNGLGISVFRDNSTRTRFSYASALNMLGLAQQDLDEGKSQIAHGETVRETANMISFCADAIGIRDDMYLGAGNAYMREVGAALDEGFEEGVLPQRPALVNLQCDIDHPTQSMADLAWLREHFGSLENLKGKKIAMTWAYSPSYGKPLSVPQGIIGLMTRYGMDVTLAHPEGYDLILTLSMWRKITPNNPAAALSRLHRWKKRSKMRISCIRNPGHLTKSWNSVPNCCVPMTMTA